MTQEEALQKAKDRMEEVKAGTDWFVGFEIYAVQNGLVEFYLMMDRVDQENKSAAQQGLIIK